MSEPASPASPQEDLVAALRRAGIGEIRDDDATRAAYSSDASLYRVPPRLVAFPRHADEIAAAISVAREAGVPLTARGAGTSVAGNAIGTGIVLDLSRHLDRVLELDPEARTARVQPGVVQAALQRAAAGA
ncbi:FAD-binding oxidoreductase, partial [Nocardioides dubius]